MYNNYNIAHCAFKFTIIIVVTQTDPYSYIYLLWETIQHYYTYSSIIRTVVRIVGMGRVSHNYIQYKMFTFIKYQQQIRLQN